MSKKHDILNADTSGLVAKVLPKGDYLCQIIEADIMKGYWKPNPPKRPKARFFKAYVPTIEIVDFVRSGDPEVDADLEEALNQFDENWKGYRPGSPKNSGRFTMAQTIDGYDDRVRCAGIANGLNFVIGEYSPDWEDFTGFADEATRFYTSANTHGEVDGFVKRLSTDPENFTPPEFTAGMTIADVIEATKGCYLIVTFGIRSDPEGKYDDQTEVVGTEPV